MSVVKFRSMAQAAQDLRLAMTPCGTLMPRAVWCVGKNYADHIPEVHETDIYIYIYIYDISPFSPNNSIASLLYVYMKSTTLLLLFFFKFVFVTLFVTLCIYICHEKKVDTVMDLKLKHGRPEYPIIFLKAGRSVVSGQKPIVKPTCTSQMDYEGELAVIIGKEAKNVKKENASEYIYGYTVCNDITARDLQKRHQQFSIGKSLDGFFPLGPQVLMNNTTDTESEAVDLLIQTYVNDELRQQGRTTQMLYTIPELIELLSMGGTLLPGDVIATGTPSGVGAAMKPPQFLEPGDCVKVVIESIGEISNTIESAE